ncbi:type 1 glutamine amidotransferase [Poriferisphaera sp. WC338]|uniref:type 1 glutamine amidotransferase n=1 Tax=Poriferisphaera sp. WC338 TaxID=3425129 RepID=UPI003D81316C
MAILVLQHHPAETPARIGHYLGDYSNKLHIVRLYADDQLPPDLDGVDGLVIMGGPQNMDQLEQYPYLECEMALIKKMHERNLPILGVCLGAQLIAVALGGKVEKMDAPEIGFGPVELTPQGRMDTIMAGMPWTMQQFHTHGYQITELPPKSVCYAGSAACKHQAFSVGLRTVGIQYHFEWSKKELEAILEQFASWISQSGVDMNDVRAGIEEHYEDYRRRGDRFTERLADILFPVDKRLTHTKGPVENFNASNY